MAGRIKFIFSSRHTRTIDPHNRHRTAFPKIVSNMIKICDVVLEVIDSRFIDDSRNIEIEKLVEENGKKLVYILNKVDLVDLDKVKEEAERKNLFPYIVVSTKKEIGKGKVIERIKIEVKRALKEKKYAVAHVGVIGYPNTGKSSLINFLTGRKDARTSQQSGFTKGVQKIRLAKGILLLDTPGVIPLGENANTSLEDLKREAKMNVRTYDKVKNPELIVFELMKENSGLFERYYGIDSEDYESFIEKLGRRNNLLTKGNKVDFDRTARMILKDWQNGKIKK